MDCTWTFPPFCIGGLKKTLKDNGKWINSMSYEDHGFHLKLSGKQRRMHCACNRQVALCKSEMCIFIGEIHGIRVGGDMCAHGKLRAICRECNGSAFCEHGKRRAQCRECGGSAYCEHTWSTGKRKKRAQCDICSPVRHAIHRRRIRRYDALKSKNPTRAVGDLCMRPRDWHAYLTRTFVYTYGRVPTREDETSIDEIIPCTAWNLPEDNKYCWHWLNSQMLLKTDNGAKNATYTEENKKAVIDRIDALLLLNENT